MPEAPAFARLQYAFAAHIRDPGRNPPPAGVEERRMRVYRELFYNNVQSLLAGTFPVLRKLLADDAWHALLQDYFARHRARTPLFPRMPEEFLHYLENERGARAADPPFLYELAHYEWVELALAVDPREPGPAAEGDPLRARPRLGPLAWPLAYRFPVHRLGPDYRPSAAPEQPTYLLAYRDRQEQVKFLELNPVSARLIEKLAANTGAGGARLLEEIAAELRHPHPERVHEGGRRLLEDLRDRGVLQWAADGG